MNNENLSQVEASERSQNISVDSYEIHLDLTNAADESFVSYPTSTTIRFSAQPSSQTFLDYIHHSIDRIELNGKQLSPNKVVEGSRIILDNLDSENTLKIKGSSLYSRSGEGLHRFFDPSDGKVYLYTQYEPADARRVFPNFEQPDLKAVFSFSVTAPTHWIVSSNGRLLRTLEDPSDSSISKRIFEATERISTYITTILAGEYFVAHDTYMPKARVNSGEIPLVAYCRDSLKKSFDYQDIFAVTKSGLDFFQDLFDYPYPFKKYEQAFVPEYNLGAMENPGLVTFTEAYIFEAGATSAQLEARANVICHEMSHMWFGDLVTMKWWNDLWLKESFADFMGSLGAREAAGYPDVWVTFANRRKAWAYNQDQMPTTHPIVAEIPHLEAAKQNFDGITYAKGASALKQLVAYVGFDTFIQAARNYFKKHAYDNTTLEDFIEVLDAASDRDIRTWADAWLKTSGLSTLTSNRTFTESGDLDSLVISQELPAGIEAAKGRPHQLKLATYKVITDSEDQQKFLATSTVDIEIPAGDAPETRVSLSPKQKPLVGKADLMVLNAEDLTYAKVYIQEADGQELACKLVSTIEDALTRGLIWGSLWNQVRDAQLSAARFVHTVEYNLASEPSTTLLSNIMTQAQSAISLYTPLAQREALFESLYTSLESALVKTVPGSDEQLIMVRAMLSLAAETDLGLEFAQEISMGATQTQSSEVEGIPGLRHNQSLGWSALIALAAQDKIQQRTLDSALASNTTATAQRGHAFASAALPHAQAKKDAFEAVMLDSKLSNDKLTATAQGFKQSAPELQLPYLAPYFQTLTEVWSKKSIGMASRTIEGLYPQVNLFAGQAGQSLAEHPVILTSKQWLEENQHAPSALRRLILEQLDQAQRSLKAQEFNS